MWTVSSRSARKGSKEALDKLRGRDGLKVVERKEVSPMELERSLAITARAGNSYRLLEEREYSERLSTSISYLVALVVSACCCRVRVGEVSIVFLQGLLARVGGVL